MPDTILVSDKRRIQRPDTEKRLRLELAAPDLLAAIKTLVGFLDTFDTVDLYSDAGKTAYDRAVAAINRAEGGNNER